MIGRDQDLDTRAGTLLRESRYTPGMTKSTCAVVIAALTTIAGAAVAQEISGAWRADCASCHGARLEGGSTPDGKQVDSLLDDNWLVTDGSNRALFEIIKSGSAKVSDHAFGGQKTDPQVWSMVVHMREVRARATNKNSKAVDGVYATQHASYRLEDVVAGGVETPWSVDFIPSVTPRGMEKLANAMLLTERGGAVRVVAKGGDGAWTIGAPIEGTPESVESGQGGMMDVAVHPEFATNGWIYLSFAKRGEGAARRGTATMTTVVRGRLEEGDGTWKWVGQETIFEAPASTFFASGVHFGCRIVFDPPAYREAKADKRYVYWSIGERGQGQHAQDLTRPNGKIHRLFDDGSVPKDNPFADAASKEKGLLASIWTYGNRNPQGMVFDLEGNLFQTEHAPRGGDELNLVKKGANYGWPMVSYGIEYSGMPRSTPWPDVSGVNEAIEMPVDIWLPSIAVCGLDVVRPGPKGEAFPGWKGDLLAGGLAGQCVDRLRIVDGKVVERENVLRGVGRVRDVVTAPDGSVYLVLNGPDKVVRMAPVAK